MALDPNDPKPPYLQVANHLRAAILTGTYTAGDRLPSVAQLTEQLGVSPMTVKKAVGILRDENLVISRQGSGTFVRERSTRPTGLRPYVEAAFEADAVTIDFAGFSGETLHGALLEPLDKVRSGRFTPSTIRLRLLVPDTSQPWRLPASAPDLADVPSFRERAESIIDRHSTALLDVVDELQSLGLVESATAEVRRTGSVQLFKLYVVNGQDAFFGFYPIVERAVKLDGEEQPMFDLMGKDATLFHKQADGAQDTTDARFVQQAQLWFETVWETAAPRSGQT
ncbi:MAG: winged helix-turn-helix domain-containing protein [Actinomycetota bacterium]